MKQILFLLGGILLLVTSPVYSSPMVDYTLTSDHEAVPCLRDLPAPRSTFDAREDKEFYVIVVLDPVSVGDTVKFEWFYEEELYSEGEEYVFTEPSIGSVCKGEGFEIPGTEIEDMTGWWSVKIYIDGVYRVNYPFYLYGVIEGSAICKGLADYDNDVDGTDASMFKTHFGRSLFKNPCPPDGPAPVEKTGQTLCYDESGTVIDCAGTGQDGEIQKGVAPPTPRFTDNGNGTVTDNLTGLTWLKDADCFGQRTWNDALSNCNGLASGSCGLTDGSSAGDWRLPNYQELCSLIDTENYNPALPSGQPFANVHNYYYWSSTTYSVNAEHAWKMSMAYGDMFSLHKLNYCYIWPVRGGH